MTGYVVFGGTMALITLMNTAAGAPLGPVFVSVLTALTVILIAGLVAPVVIARRVRVERIDGPRDATVGDETELTLLLGGPRGDIAVRVLDPPGPWFRAPAGREVQIPHRATARGVFDGVRVEVSSTAPVGFFDARHVIFVTLPAPIRVGPLPIDVSWRPGAAPVDGTEATGARTLLSGEMIRSVRPYSAGDPARLVHWPSTARTGDLVVKELDPPNPVGQAIVLDLQGLARDEAELAASYAMGAAVAVLAAGGRVIVCTSTAGAPVTEQVPSRLGASRLLAAADAGPTGTPPPDWPVVEIGR